MNEYVIFFYNNSKMLKELIRIILKWIKVETNNRYGQLKKFSIEEDAER